MMSRSWENNIKVDPLPPSSAGESNTAPSLNGNLLQRKTKIQRNAVPSAQTTIKCSRRHAPLSLSLSILSLSILSPHL